jgi:hypothetical protein
MIRRAKPGIGVSASERYFHFIGARRAVFLAVPAIEEVSKMSEYRLGRSSFCARILKERALASGIFTGDRAQRGSLIRLVEE